MVNLSYIELKDVCKSYGQGNSQVIANDNVSFTIEEGEFVVILGPSGAGKSTVLNILGGMDQATSGEIWVAGKNIANFNERELTAYRRDNVGFVFQFYNLIPNLTAKENVETAEQIADQSFTASEVLKEVNLADRENNFPAQLSGGEQQRVSIARAIAKNPKLLLCDEPTGALDNDTGQQVLKLLQKQSVDNGTTVVVITHNQNIAHMADRVIRIKNGQVESNVTQDDPKQVEEIEW